MGGDAFEEVSMISKEADSCSFWEDSDCFDCKSLLTLSYAERGSGMKVTSSSRPEKFFSSSLNLFISNPFKLMNFESLSSWNFLEFGLCSSLGVIKRALFLSVIPVSKSSFGAEVFGCNYDSAL